MILNVQNHSKLILVDFERSKSISIKNLSQFNMFDYKITQIKIAQNHSKLVKIVQNHSKLIKIIQNRSKSIKIVQNRFLQQNMPNFFAFLSMTRRCKGKLIIP